MGAVDEDETMVLRVIRQPQSFYLPWQSSLLQGKAVANLPTCIGILHTKATCGNAVPNLPDAI